jgi:hypothetical protein
MRLIPIICNAIIICLYVTYNILYCMVEKKSIGTTKKKKIIRRKTGCRLDVSMIGTSLV